jgi:hypothetical protein
MENFQMLREKLESEFAGNPHRSGLISEAFGKIAEGRAELKKLGHFFDLSEREAGTVVEFPKWLHHQTKGSVIVASQEEQEALGDEWHEATPDSPQTSSEEVDEEPETPPTVVIPFQPPAEETEPAVEVDDETA